MDAVVEQLLGAGVEPDDIVVDCGNSLWTDTIRRERHYADPCRFFGSGVSGGEVGARFGPSLMPGGHPASWEQLRPIWEATAAKADPNTGKPLEDWAPGKPAAGGEPCTAYIGPDGVGHYVKMVHNGIEYIDMQLISEAYHVLTALGGMTPDRLSEIFAEWNQNELSSYLIELTADSLKQRGPAKPTRFLVDMVLDAAGQKGTGKWTSVSALDMGIPANAIAEAVFARCLSALKDERVAAAKILEGPPTAYRGTKQRRRNTTGRSTSAPSLPSGAAAASFGPASRQPLADPGRLLRRPHVRARGRPAWDALPRGLARPQAPATARLTAGW